MRKWKNKLFPLFFILITVCLSLFSGCFYGGYSGTYRGAYTTAYSCIPGARGLWFCGPFYEDSVIIPLEKDENGRTMYAYMEEKGPLSVLIVQQETGDIAYYYPEDCYLSFRTELSDYLYDFTKQDLIQILQTHLTEEDWTAFKALNDWNEPLQEEKCESTPITHNPPKGGLVDNGSVYEKVLLQYFEKENKYIHPDNYNIGDWVTLWQKDAYGRKLIVISATVADYYDKREVRYSYTFVVIFNPDGSYNLDTMMPLGDRSTFSETVKQVKIIGNWNQPLV